VKLLTIITTPFLFLLALTGIWFLRWDHRTFGEIEGLICKVVVTTLSGRSIDYEPLIAVALPTQPNPCKVVQTVPG
jgi:hypothetical protein